MLLLEPLFVLLSMLVRFVWVLILPLNASVSADVVRSAGATAAEVVPVAAAGC